MFSIQNKNRNKSPNIFTIQLWGLSMPHAFELDLSISRGVITHNMLCLCVLTFCFPQIKKKKLFFGVLHFMHNASLKRKSWKWVY